MAFIGQLFETQKEGAEFLVNKKRALLAWSQGTGKTIISMAAAEKLRELDKIHTSTLVLSPGGLCWQFAERLEEFTDSRVHLVDARKKKSRTYDTRKKDYHVVSYAVFRNDFNAISSQAWDCVIADEAEAFSNNKSQTYKKLLAFNRAVVPRYRWSLSGTAVSNELQDLYAIMYWTDKHFLPPWPDFEAKHIVRDKAFGTIVSYKNLKPLNTYLKNKVNRKTEDDLKGKMPKLLPPQIHTIPKDKEYADAEVQLLEGLEDLAENLEFENGELKSSGRSPRVARDFARARKALISKGKRQYAVALAERILQESPSNKIVFFSFYKEPLKALAQDLGDIQSVTYTGDDNSDTKKANIQHFRTDTDVLLASNAGARGLDLPFANYVIHLDIPFSYGVLDQRTKRIVRASSEFDRVVVIYLMVENSIEHHYYYMVRQKEKLAGAVLDKGNDTVVMKTQSLRQFLND